MPLRLCSILGTLLLALAVATPVLAQETQAESSKDSSEKSATRAKQKKRKAKAEKSEQAELADATTAVDKAEADAADKPDKGSAQSSSKKKKGKKGKKGKDKDESAEKDEDKAGDDKSKSDESLTASDASATEAATPEPDAWEKPPEEEEKPPASATPKAAAEKPAGDGKPWSAGLIVGWAFETDRRTTGFSADPYGLGAGLRGGYSLPEINLYAGLYFMYYLGSAVTGSSQYVANAEITTNASYMQFGAEVGYDWWIASVIIRPSIQLGAALVFTDVPNVQSPINDFMFAPGLTVVHPWDGFFLGGDLRANVVTGNGSSSILLAATGGLRF